MTGQYFVIPVAAATAGIAASQPEKKQSGGTLKPNFIQRLEDPNRKTILD